MKFQSTLPVRGATGPAPSKRVPGKISIHAPREGSDVELVHGLVALGISIHAPREGSDCEVLDMDKDWKNFNPRSP